MSDGTVESVRSRGWKKGVGKVLHWYLIESKMDSDYFPPDDNPILKLSKIHRQPNARIFIKDSIIKSSHHLQNKRQKGCSTSDNTSSLESVTRRTRDLSGSAGGCRC
jgi:hypothetical protein